MTRITIARATLVAAVAAVSGCSSLFGPEGYFRDRGDDYLKADVIEPMRLPPGVQQQRVEQLFVIPSSNGVVIEGESFEVPRPQALSDNAFTDRVKIQKLGDKRWILVSAAPAEIWPQVRAFLTQYNLSVASTNAANGIIETDWLQFKGSDGTRDKYRLQIEQGVQPDSTEIHVRHMSVDSALAGRGQVNWPALSVSAERESWMLDELAANIASQGDTESASLLAQTIAVNDKVTLDTESAEPVLRLALEHERAWATLRHAADQGGFTLWDQDDTAGVFYVEYIEPDDEEPGFFSRWFGGGGKPPTSPYSLDEVLQHLQLDEGSRALFAQAPATAGEPLKGVPGYLIVTREQGGQLEVRIRDGYARSLKPREAKKLLAVLRGNLI
ncbi:outer membrane protein assembly factor BamC [Pseudomaricurvus sp. HS19]|uniref:outer membrane protein assembly factor BamC n=1 Tax=Pseudomaricurvus sp. HS19 TaxID=2692626 RepID=UPI00136EF468|nr:outer membrane protein assembly factor BamC [Pseudomaricurvus sp. HS19]MYM65051.1 outer membrane protein assembly factor BamC [Pseudomaricurvus sp. HS19]